MKTKRQFDAKKAVKFFYSGKKRKLNQYAETDRNTPTIEQLSTAKAILKKLR